jgi:hypothetical protein
VKIQPQWVVTPGKQTNWSNTSNTLYQTMVYAVSINPNRLCLREMLTF